MERNATKIVSIFDTNSEEETIEAGKEFSKKLLPGDVVAIYGDLGSGKTEFVKGACKNLHVQELVTSPTFSIMNQYTGSYNNNEIKIYHIDLYRIKTPKDLEEIGFDDCIYSSNSIKFIEWAEKAEDRLTNLSYEVSIKLYDNDENKRTIEISKPS